MTAHTNEKRLAKARRAIVMVLLAAWSGVMWADHEDGMALSYLVLQPGFTQDLFGVSPGVRIDEGNLLGGVAVRPADQDMWVSECLFSGSPMHRFDRQGEVDPTVDRASETHPEFVVTSNAGCGIVNHPNGFIYSNTDLGLVRLSATTGNGATTLGGPAGNGLGIAVDPMNGNNLYYIGAACNQNDPGDCPIHEVTPAGALVRTITLPGIDAGWIDGLYFSPNGMFMFLANRQNDLDDDSDGAIGPDEFRLTILQRTVVAGPDIWTLAQHVPLACEPDGVAFHAAPVQFVVTNNTDNCVTPVPDPLPDPTALGTMTRFDFPANNYALPPTQMVFAAGGFRGDLMQVADDGCIYLTQAGTRYDNGETTPENSLVKICELVGPGFEPPPGVEPPYLQTAPLTAKAGATIQYQMTYLNAGPFPSQGASVTAFLSPHVTFVSASPGGYVRYTETGEVRWNLGTVGVLQGQTMTLTVRVRSNTPAGTVITGQSEYAAQMTLAPPGASATLVVP
jgi:uncharacterized repeat protein (TIGR01451 family)